MERKTQKVTAMENRERRGKEKKQLDDWKHAKYL